MEFISIASHMKNKRTIYQLKENNSNNVRMGYTYSIGESR